MRRWSVAFVLAVRSCPPRLRSLNREMESCVTNLASFCVRPRKDRALSVIKRFLPVSEQPFHILSFCHLERILSCWFCFSCKLKSWLTFDAIFEGRRGKQLCQCFGDFVTKNIAKGTTDPRLSSFAKESAETILKDPKIQFNISTNDSQSVYQSFKRQGNDRTWVQCNEKIPITCSRKAPATIRLGQGEGELVLHLMMIYLINVIDINDKIKIRNNVSWLAATPARVKRIEKVIVLISGAKRDLN